MKRRNTCFSCYQIGIITLHSRIHKAIFFYNIPLYSTDSWQKVVNACITKKSAQLRDVAVLALRDLCQTYYTQPSYANSNVVLLESYIAGTYNDLEENMRMGYVLALGSLPRFILKLDLKNVLTALKRHSLTPHVQRTVLEVDELKSHQYENPIAINWSEARRDSIKALINVVQTIGFDSRADGEGNVAIGNEMVLASIFKCFLCAMDEYTIDDRGDIGAWVREAAMNGKPVVICSRE